MRQWLQIVFIVCATVLVYMHVPYASFMPIDDGSLTYKNPIVTEYRIGETFSTYDPELYVPLTLMSYMVDYTVGGEDPAVFHITNLLLHIINALLVFLLTKKLVKNPWAPFVAGLVFALHPLHAETVMWIAARKDLLSAAFFLSSILLYIQFRISGRRVPYYLSLALFAFALLAKVVTATLPLVLLLIDDVVQTKQKHHSHHKLPYAALALAFLLIGILGKTLSFYQITFFQTFLLAGKSAVFYLQKLIIPTDLSIFHQQISPIHIAAPEFSLPLVGLLLLYLIALKGRQINKLISFGILWYGVTLLPNLANFSRLSKESIFFASDRYAYLPSIGLIILTAYGLSKLHTTYYKLLTGLAIVLLATLTHLQSLTWLAPTPLFAHAITVEPRTHMAHTMLGILAQNNERHTEAITHFRDALELAPTFANAKAHLGLSLIKDGQINRGIFELTETVQHHPEYTHAYEYLAYGYLLQRDSDAARAAIHTLQEFEPENAKSFYLLGLIAQEEGNTEEAKQHIIRALELNPRDLRAKGVLLRL